MIASLLAGVALTLGLSLSAGPASAPAASVEPALAIVAVQAGPQVGPGTDAGTVASSGLPQRAPDARTMRDLWPAFLVLSLAWTGIVVYSLGLTRPAGRIARSVERLSGEIPPRAER